MKKIIAMLAVAAFAIAANAGSEKAKSDHKCSETCKDKCKAEHKCSDACKDKCKEEKKK